LLFDERCSQPVPHALFVPLARRTHPLLWYPPMHLAGCPSSSRPHTHAQLLCADAPPAAPSDSISRSLISGLGAVHSTVGILPRHQRAPWASRMCPLGPLQPGAGRKQYDCCRRNELSCPHPQRCSEGGPRPTASLRVSRMRNPYGQYIFSYRNREPPAPLRSHSPMPSLQNVPSLRTQFGVLFFRSQGTRLKKGHALAVERQ